MNIGKKQISPWIISLVAVIIICLILMGYDYSAGNPILSKVGEIILFSWNIVYAFLNINIKMWWLLTAFLLFIFALFLVIHFKDHITPRHPV